MGQEHIIESFARSVYFSLVRNRVQDTGSEFCTDESTIEEKQIPQKFSDNNRFIFRPGVAVGMNDSPKEQIRDRAYDILTGYKEAKETNDFRHLTVEYVKNQLPDALETYVSNKLLSADHAKFIGKLNNIPWVSLSHDEISGAPQDGLYIVYLFDYQAEQLILSLGHGTKKPKEKLGKKDARDLLTTRASELRNHVSVSGFNEEAPELEGTTSRSDLWGPATVCYKRYTPGDFPDSEKFIDDLDRLIEQYLELIDGEVFNKVTKKHPASYENGDEEEDSASQSDGPETRAAQLYQVILKKDRSTKIWNNYRQTVKGDVPAGAIQQFFDSPVDDPTRLWGAINLRDLQEDDIVIFADRDGPQIQLIGRVSKKKTLDHGDAVSFAQVVGWEYDSSSPYTDIVLLDRLWKPAISIDEFFNAIGYGGLPVGTWFQRIKIEASESTFDEQYGSVQEFQTEATGELVFPEPSDSDMSDHHLVEHAKSNNPTVWTFNTNPSDILTNIRRSAVHQNESRRTKWMEIQDGDIILLRCKGTEDKIGSLDDVDRPGIVGAGIVTEHSQKTGRWWWNEFVSLDYTFLLEFEELHIAGDPKKIDLTTPTFQQSVPALEAEIESVLASNIPYSKFRELVDKHTREQARRQGEFQKHRFEDGAEDFVNAIVSEFDSLYSLDEAADSVDNPPEVDREPRRDRLPAMIPQEDEPDQADELKTQITDTGQIVLYGPPGTGKTFTARRFARWWLTNGKNRVPENRFRTVTFHPSFAYEDFMEGLTAEATDDDQIEYQYKDGVFKQLCNDAREAYQATIGTDETPPSYVLLIDELNRGNLAKIFGEAITQLELDKRLDGEEATSSYWAHSGEKMAIPPNLYLIGTMNTADQSITLVDAAIRRRFSFHSFPPNFDILIKKYDIENESAEFEKLLNHSRQVLEGINERIRHESELGRGKQIGHSYLLGLEDAEDIVNAWQFEILPLLEEYYFGDIRGLVEDILDIDEPDWDDFPLFDMDRLEIANLNGDTKTLKSGLEMMPKIDHSNNP